MARLSTVVQLRRYFFVLETLLSHRQGLDYNEMMEEWRHSSYNDFDEEVIPKRTLSGYFREIESLFQITISYDAHRRRYFLVNPDEIYDDTFKKRMLSGFAVNNILNNGNGELRNRIMTENIPSGEEFLIKILNAMKSKKCITVMYQKFSDKEAKKQQLEPYFLKLFHQRWYVVAKTVGGDKLRVYALDRIKDLTIDSQTFSCPKNIDVHTYFIDCFGIEHNTDDYDVEDIKLKVYNAHNKCQYIRALPLHHSQKELEKHDDYSIFQVTVYPTYDFMQEILSHGNEIEVLEPLWVREEFKKKIATMLERYSK